MYLDSIDKNIINLVQVQFPLTRQPYADLGRRLGIAGSEVVHRLQQLKAKPEKVELSQRERLIIRELQQDLPLVAMPFNGMATQLNMAVTDFLVGCQSLLQRGIIRRFGAAINHHRAGFRANAMACWTVPSDMVATIGQKLASLREVSHCYERQTNALWHYNLFAMIHGRAREACQRVAANISRRVGLKDYILLFSTREFKKTRVRYLV